MATSQMNIEEALIPVPVVTTPREKHLREARQFQGIPGIEVTPRGRLWATWYSGGTGEGLHNFVLVITSADKGASWSDPVAIVDPPSTHVRAYDPALWIDPRGDSGSSGPSATQRGRALSTTAWPVSGAVTPGISSQTTPNGLPRCASPTES